MILSAIPRRLRARALAVSLLVLTGFAPLAQATPFDYTPKLLLHARALTVKNQCTTWGSLGDCTAANTYAQFAPNPIGPFYYVYLLAATGYLRGSALGGNDMGVAGLQCGIRYAGIADGQGVDIFVWVLCATLEFSSGGWPTAGGGNLITWDPVNHCQRGEVAVAGYFYCGAYSEDLLQLTPRPLDQLAAVADCNAVTYDLTEGDLGSVRFTSQGQTPGCNPCLMNCTPPTPVDRVSWGRIKGLYGAGR